MQKLYSKIFRVIILLITGAVALYAAINAYIIVYADRYINILPQEPVTYGIILGASVQDGELSDVLQDRVDRAIALYHDGKFETFFVSGDDGDQWYKEVASIVEYLKKQGVSESVIIADPHGFDTYDSMRRAHNLYDIDKAFIFTQGFHLSRSVYIARRLDIDARGVTTDLHRYYDTKRFQIRESAARIKAFIEVEFINAMPASLEKIDPPM